MMRVGFDEQVVVGQPMGGFSRAVVELVAAFAADPGHGVEVVPGWTFGTNRFAQASGLARRPPVDVGRWPARASSFAANTAARRRARRSDLWHRTYYTGPFLRMRHTGPTAITVHDLIPERFPALFPQGNPHLLKRDYVQSSDLVLCSSEATRTDLLELYGDPGVPVVVTPLGVGERWFVAEPAAPTERGYVLHLGRRDAYKDFDVLARAMARVDPRWRLVAVGGGPFTDHEHDLLARLGLAGRSEQRDADDAQLAALYRGAGAFVFPSRYEGFGLPTLEAMASGCPVVLPRAASHPEVGGDAAAYFDPEDDTQLADLLIALLEDPGRRLGMSRAGLERARSLTWARTAARTADAYRLVL